MTAAGGTPYLGRNAADMVMEAFGLHMVVPGKKVGITGPRWLPSPSAIRLLPDPPLLCDRARCTC